MSARSSTKRRNEELESNRQQPIRRSWSFAVGRHALGKLVPPGCCGSTNSRRRRHDARPLHCCSVGSRADNCFQQIDLARGPSSVSCIPTAGCPQCRWAPDTCRNCDRRPQLVDGVDPECHDSDVHSIRRRFLASTKDHLAKTLGGRDRHRRRLGAVGGIPSAIDSRAMLAIGASLTAALLYAVGGVYARKSFQDTPPLTLALGQQLAAVALLVPVSAVAPPPGPITVGPLIAVAALGLGATAGGYLVYFWVIRQAGPVAASAVTLLVPISASAIGVLWLNEPVTFALIGGLVIILAGVGLLLDLPPTRDPSRRVAPGRAASADKRPVSG